MIQVLLIVWVSPSFALCLDMRFDVLNSLLTVLTPVGEVYLINRFLSGCEVCIEDEILLVDLVELRECLNDGVMFSISEAGDNSSCASTIIIGGRSKTVAT